jgi:hypothetical protein
MTSLLEQLQQPSMVVAGSGDIAALERCSPQGATQKLAEGIRQFHADEALLGQLLWTLH